MLFVIDAGNTNIVLGAMEGSDVRCTARIPTQPKAPAEHYAAAFSASLEAWGRPAFEGAILSSVVPELTSALVQAAQAAVGRTPLVVGPGIKTGLKARACPVEALGADLIAGAVAALDKYPCPMAVFDLGTATTLSVLDGEGWFLGGAILAGPKLGLAALSSGTGLLPQVELSRPDRLIHTDTAACMNAGAIIGHAAMLDGLLDRTEEELGRPLACAVGTGGLFPWVGSFCRRKIFREDDLVLHGLQILYEMNA